MPVFQLNKSISFPPPHMARADGLLAVGGDLSHERLILAYQMGIFPWYSPGQPILWWSPDPRLVLFLNEFKISKRLARTIRQKKFTITFDSSFKEVISACRQTRSTNGEGTWIDGAMLSAYCHLHELGYAHSVEAWRGDELVGGLYGISMGKIFYGESMFSKVSDSSKIALAALVNKLKKNNFACIDCQVTTGHLISLGAQEISGEKFQHLLEKYSATSAPWPHGKIITS